MARPNKGVNHVDEIQGTRESKRRAKLILETISGTLSVKEACERLGIRTTQFANLRRLFLRYGIEGLQPRPAGRRRRAKVVSLRELDLMQRAADLERENQLLRAQVEVAALRRQGVASRPKSVGEAATASSPSRSTGGERAVPGPRAADAARPPAQSADDAAAGGAAGAP